MENNSSLQLKLPILFSVVLIIGMFLGFKLSHSFSNTKDTCTAQLDNLVNLIQNEYVDSLDKEVLVNNGIDGILKTLDPHTVYIPKQDVTQVNEQLEGEFYGIGIEFYLQNDTVTISAVIPNSPSENKGFIAGDKILKIDDSLVAGKSLSDDEIITRIRGKLNAPIQLNVLHLNNKTENIIIKRGIVPIKSVKSSFKINENTGYISIAVFSENTYTEFKEALEKLVNQHIDHLIIDVRDNPGGYMDAVTNIADELIAGKKTLVKTIGKNQTDSVVSGKLGLFEKGKVSVLINENSASASEILAGIIQDLERGTVIGRRSYGKGLVQEQFELPDGSAIRITVARYYLPSGRCIQKSYTNGKEEYENDIEKRYNHGELSSLDSLAVDNLKEYYTAINHKKVLANSGISPDVFVPIDTTFNNKLVHFYINHIAEKFASSYYYFHKNDFAQYKNIDDFHKQFSVTTSMKKDVETLFNQYKIPTSYLFDSKLFPFIESGIKAELSKLQFGNNGKNFELSFEDKAIQKAIQ